MRPTTPAIVVVGASRGGLAATRVLLHSLPRTLDCAVVLAQHRGTDVSGVLLELLRTHSRLPVSEPDDKEPIRRGHVYLAPADYHLLVERGVFSLSLDAPVWFARPSIDVLFQSAADSYGPSAVAVMLTCSNEDGAAGAKAVKGAGGRVLVQDPATAEAPEAPRAVLACTRVDAVLPVGDLAAEIAALWPIARRPR